MRQSVVTCFRNKYYSLDKQWRENEKTNNYN